MILTANLSSAVSSDIFLYEIGFGSAARPSNSQSTYSILGSWSLVLRLHGLTTEAHPYYVYLRPKDNDLPLLEFDYRCRISTQNLPRCPRQMRVVPQWNHLWIRVGGRSTVTLFRPIGKIPPSSNHVSGSCVWWSNECVSTC